MLWRSIWSRIWLTLNSVENHPALPQHDAASLDEDIAADVIEPDGIIVHVPPEIKDRPSKDDWVRRISIINEIIARPFETPLPIIPKRRYPRYATDGSVLEHGVYSLFGRAPREKDNKRYRKARARVFTDLPGSWNNGKGRLYVQEDMGLHLRQALSRCEEIEERISISMGRKYPVLSAIQMLGAYSHRPIRHRKGANLSYHSWPIAVDANPRENRGVSYHPTWQRRKLTVTNNQRQTLWLECEPFQAVRGPVNTVLPFSKQFYEVFPESLPYEVIMAFKSVGFAWGGDWGRSGWHKVVRKFGTHYDQTKKPIAESKEFLDAQNEWKNHRFYDGMHMELIMRGVWAEHHWVHNQQRLAKNLHA